MPIAIPKILFSENFLYKTPANSWSPNNSNYKFGFDSLPNIMFDVERLAVPAVPQVGNVVLSLPIWWIVFHFIEKCSVFFLIQDGRRNKFSKFCSETLNLILHEI